VHISLSCAKFQGDRTRYKLSQHTSRVGWSNSCKLLTGTPSRHHPPIPAQYPTHSAFRLLSCTPMPSFVTIQASFGPLRQYFLFLPSTQANQAQGNGCFLKVIGSGHPAHLWIAIDSWILWHQKFRQITSWLKSSRGKSGILPAFVPKMREPAALKAFF